MSVYFLALAASFLVSLISLVGSFLLIYKRVLGKSFSTLMVSFAAGVMLTTAFLDLFPEAQEAAGGKINIFVPAFLGFAVLFILERFLLWFHHHDDLPDGQTGPHGAKPATFLILLSDAVHNLIDGIVIGTTFIANPALGLVSTLAVAAHEVPQEFADFSALIALGMKKTKALLFNFISAVSAIFGTLLTFAFGDIIETNVGFLLAFTAGMFIYIAASDLIPELHMEFKKRKDWSQAVPFLMGVVIIILSIRLLEG